MTRCEYTWNPGTWPYIKRCRNNATQQVGIDGEATGDDNVDLCNEHAALVLKGGEEHGNG